MPHADPLAALRAADPARALPAFDRAAVLDAALAATPAPIRHRPTRRRLLPVPIAAVLALLLTGAAWKAYDRWVSPASPAYANAIREAEATTPLPPGHTWTLPASLTAGTDDGVPVLTAVDSAKLLITMHAICHWESAWSDAIAQRSTAGQARSAAALDLLVGRIPLHVEGMPEDVPSMDAAGIALYHQIAAAARTGDAAGLRNDLTLNCPPGVRQPTRW